ncbi:hypothetical protein KIPB_006786, partial [Kipferlia bialata]
VLYQTTSGSLLTPQLYVSIRNHTLYSDVLTFLSGDRALYTRFHLNTLLPALCRVQISTQTPDAPQPESVFGLIVETMPYLALYPQYAAPGDKDRRDVRMGVDMDSSLTVLQCLHSVVHSQHSLGIVPTDREIVPVLRRLALYYHNVRHTLARKASCQVADAEYCRHAMALIEGIFRTLDTLYASSPMGREHLHMMVITHLSSGDDVLGTTSSATSDDLYEYLGGREQTFTHSLYTLLSAVGGEGEISGAEVCLSLMTHALLDGTRRDSQADPHHLQVMSSTLVHFSASLLLSSEGEREGERDSVEGDSADTARVRATATLLQCLQTFMDTIDPNTDNQCDIERLPWSSITDILKILSICALFAPSAPLHEKYLYIVGYILDILLSHSQTKLEGGDAGRIVPLVPTVHLKRVFLDGEASIPDILIKRLLEDYRPRTPNGEEHVERERDLGFDPEVLSWLTMYYSIFSDPRLMLLPSTVRPNDALLVTLIPATCQSFLKSVNAEPAEPADPNSLSASVPLSLGIPLAGALVGAFTAVSNQRDRESQRDLAGSVLQGFVPKLIQILLSQQTSPIGDRETER